MKRLHTLTVRLPNDISKRLQNYLLDHPDQSANSVAVSAFQAFLPKQSGQQTGVKPMNQTPESGREGQQFGLSAGRALADKLGTLLSPIAAELKLRDGRLATIRTAKAKNTTWGCLNGLRDRVDVIICAYTKDGQTFDLWEVSREDWRANARNASSGSSMRDKLTLMSKSAVQRVGRALPGIEL
jgi:predicted transcriptional regulator